MKRFINPRVVKKNQGMTLFELLIVLTILSFLATIVAPRVVGYLGKAKADVARSQMSNISTSLELFFLDAERYPEQEEGLQALVSAPANADWWNGPYLKDKEGLMDPWGELYLYTVDNENDTYTITTLGKDKQAGGTGDDADIEIR